MLPSQPPEQFLPKLQPGPAARTPAGAAAFLINRSQGLFIRVCSAPPAQGWCCDPTQDPRKARWGDAAPPNTPQHHPLPAAPLPRAGGNSGVPPSSPTLPYCDRCSLGSGGSGVMASVVLSPVCILTDREASPTWAWMPRTLGHVHPRRHPTEGASLSWKRPNWDPLGPGASQSSIAVGTFPPCDRCGTVLIPGASPNQEHPKSILIPRAS